MVRIMVFLYHEILVTERRDAGLWGYAICTFMWDSSAVTS